MRILVTGSRNYTDFYRVFDALNKFALVNSTVVHGACPTGADKFADQWAKSQPDITVEPHPANWKEYGKSAGPIRNGEMVKTGIDLCLAFVDECSKPNCPHKEPHMSHGTHDCIMQAKAAGIQVIRFE